MSDDMRRQALDVESHWVTEHGQEGQLTAGATVKATASVVGSHTHTSPRLTVRSTPSRTAQNSISS
jgi:hypothetical protein